MYHYQLDPPAPRNQVGDEYDDCVTWVRCHRPAMKVLQEIADRTGSELTEIELRDDDGVDFTLPWNTPEELEAHLMQPRHQGLAKKKVRITFAALTRQEIVREVEVPDEATDEEIGDLADDIYENDLDGSEDWVEDNEYWERGQTRWEAAS